MPCVILGNIFLVSHNLLLQYFTCLKAREISCQNWETRKIIPMLHSAPNDNNYLFDGTENNLFRKVSGINCLFTFRLFYSRKWKNINFYGDRKKGQRWTNSKPLPLVNKVLDGKVFLLIISRYLMKEVLIKGTYWQLCTREEYLSWNKNQILCSTSFSYKLLLQLKMKTCHKYNIFS